ncbi:MAG: hypothetical protein ACU0DK_05540 [Pseudooceanicola sp.]
MSRRIWKGLVAMGLGATLALPAHAAQLTCTFRSVQAVGAAGMLATHGLEGRILSKPAIVDTETGRIAHIFFGNEAFADVQVIDAGSAQSGMKILSLSAEGKLDDAAGTPFRNWRIFEIEVFRDGAAKPFVAVNGGGYVGTGVCE